MCTFPVHWEKTCTLNFYITHICDKYIKYLRKENMHMWVHRLQMLCTQHPKYGHLVQGALLIQTLYVLYSGFPHTLQFFSMIISQFSMTISLLKFCIHDLLRKRSENADSVTPASFLNVCKKGTKLVKSRGNIGKIS